MNRVGAQVLATIVIWLAFVLVMIFGRYPNVSEGNAVFLSATLVIGAALSTLAVWGFPAHQDTQAEAAKAKRRSRVERVLDGMDEQELEELRARLMSADGELADMSELLSESRTSQALRR